MPSLCACVRACECVCDFALFMQAMAITRPRLQEELHIAVEQIGSYLRVSYPHAFIPRRADSPSNAIDVHKGFFSDDMDAAQGVKRPKPEGFKPYHKLAEMTQTTVVLPAVLRSPVLKAQKKHNGDVPSSILQVPGWARSL